MDTSETYIKMRLAARQDLLDGIPPEMTIDCEDNTIEPEWITADVFVDIKGDFYYSPTGHPHIFNVIDICQLERQDQLQEMVDDMPRLCLPEWAELSKPRYLLQVVHQFYVWICEQDTLIFSSMEQLWLSFIMEKCYSKIWDGEDWVTAEVLVKQ